MQYRARVTDVRPALTVTPQPSMAHVTRFALAGVLDAGAPLEAFGTIPRGRLELDLSGVRRVTSFGVRDWIEACRRIPAGVTVVWERVSLPMVAQLGMVANFAGSAHVASFFAPYYCPKCDADVPVLLTPEAAPDGAPARSCGTCGTALRFEELESDFFAFLR